MPDSTLSTSASWLRLANEVLVVAGLRQEVSVDHSIELLDNGPRRRCSVRAQRFSHTVVILAERVRLGNAALRQTLSPRRIVPRHRCGQPRSPVRPTAPLINHNDRWGQQECGSRRRARAPWASPRRTRRVPKTRSATRRRIGIIDAFGGRRARCLHGCWVGPGVRAQGPKVESTSPPSEYRSTLLKNMHLEKQQMCPRRRRPPRSCWRSTSLDTKKDPGRNHRHRKPVRSRRWRRRRRRRPHRSVLIRPIPRNRC